jgi:hypothetical protein
VNYLSEVNNNNKKIREKWRNVTKNVVVNWIVDLVNSRTIDIFWIEPMSMIAIGFVITNSIEGIEITGWNKNRIWFPEYNISNRMNLLLTSDL